MPEHGPHQFAAATAARIPVGLWAMLVGGTALMAGSVVWGIAPGPEQLDTSLGTVAVLMSVLIQMPAYAALARTVRSAAQLPMLFVVFSSGRLLLAVAVAVFLAQWRGIDAAGFWIAFVASALASLAAETAFAILVFRKMHAASGAAPGGRVE